MATTKERDKEQQKGHIATKSPPVAAHHYSSRCGGA
jgi:hypothetical protein